MSNTIDVGQLRGGDADNNNRVNIIECSVLAAFGTATGNPTFNANANFNGDGTVNILDFSIRAANFAQVGPAQPTP